MSTPLTRSPMAIGPVKEFAPPRLTSLSGPAGPPVKRVTASPATATPPLRARVPLACTVVPPAALPSADELAATSVPALTVVAPAYELGPLSVNVPVPTLVNPPPPEIVPANVVLVLFVPVVSVPLPDVTLLPLTPVSEPIVVLVPPRSSVAPLVVMLTVVPTGRMFPPPP